MVNVGQKQLEKFSLQRTKFQHQFDFKRNSPDNYIYDREHENKPK